ncbi:unnamed protein product [Phytophthora fragariaefolia]|uniref:Unnamed protein product n=1 Tax=Phytophthora fragariaefolia TaxID=1490495 RepID=A0A9W6XWV4_9STRA|nr:unnamed protein product [Phytophthora fragariaefolia]
MIAASSTNSASGTSSGGGSTAPSVSLAPPARNDGHSSCDESEDEEVVWQPTGSKDVSPNSERTHASVRAFGVRFGQPLPRCGSRKDSGTPVEKRGSSHCSPNAGSATVWARGFFGHACGGVDLTGQAFGHYRPGWRCSGYEKPQRRKDLPTGWLLRSGGARPDGESGGHGVGGLVPPECQTVITIMANDNLAFQPPPFVRMDPPQDEDDEETKASDAPAPDSFLDQSRGASTTAFGFKSSQLGKRASGSQSPKPHKKSAPDGVQEFPSEWFGSSNSSRRPEEVPLPLSRTQVRASLADYPVVWKIFIGTSTTYWRTSLNARKL